jgi:hypothetical protein
VNKVYIIMCYKMANNFLHEINPNLVETLIYFKKSHSPVSPLSRNLTTLEVVLGSFNLRVLRLTEIALTLYMAETNYIGCLYLL